MNNTIETRQKIEVETENNYQIIPLTNRRRRGTFSKEILPEIQSELASEYSQGKTMMQLSEQYKVSIPSIREFLVKMTLLRKRGHGSKPRGRRRSTNIITNDLLNQAKQLAVNIGITRTAKQLNLNIVELTRSLAAEGIIIQKGHRKQV